MPVAGVSELDLGLRVGQEDLQGRARRHPVGGAAAPVRFGRPAGDGRIAEHAGAQPYDDRARDPRPGRVGAQREDPVAGLRPAVSRRDVVDGAGHARPSGPAGVSGVDLTVRAGEAAAHQ